MSILVGVPIYSLNQSKKLEVLVGATCDRRGIPALDRKIVRL